MVVGAVALILVSAILHLTFSDNLLGCNYQADLCSAEEVCVNDGVFGQCQSEPLDLYRYRLSPAEFELLRLELERLVLHGLEWSSNRVQCVLRYFLVVNRYGLQYDVDFCNAKRPANVLSFLQAMSRDLNQNDNQMTTANDEDGDDTVSDYADVDSAVIDNVVEQLVKDSLSKQLPAGDKIQMDNNNDNDGDDDDEAGLDRSHRLRQTAGDYDDVDDDDDDDKPSYALNKDEENLLNSLILQVMKGEKPDLSGLNERQLDKFIVYVQLLEKLLQENSGMTEGDVNVEDKVSKKNGDDGDELQKFLYKKDKEKFDILDQGTGNKVHRIQTRLPSEVTPAPAKADDNDRKFKVIEGNRIYFRLSKNITTAEDVDYLEKLKSDLEEKIAKPNNLTFSNYNVFGNEVSFRVDSASQVTPEWLLDVFEDEWLQKDMVAAKPHNIDSLRIADDLYKVIKKTQVGMSNVPEITESGVGNPQNGVPVRGQADEEDNFVLPTLIVCGLVIGTLIVVLGLYVYRSRSRAKTALQLLAADLEGKPSKDYQELCRQRMSGKTDERLESMVHGTTGGAGIVGTLAQRLGSQSEPSPPAHLPNSDRSSTSSWSEEPVQTNMDISTGHTILTYMEDHLMNKDRLEQEWASLESYQADLCATTVAELADNTEKNRYQDILPYDHSRVVLSKDTNQRGSDYINASFICDHDPRNPSHIATQGPLHETTADFWQMVWEQGSVVIVNLTKLVENGETKCVRYWPENGSEVYHIYEVHLVSEHIWCTDYLVRSFYLKNLQTQETRTVTQFHFLTWPEDGLPTSTKALLDFRRKVNKSYRGRSCPIVLHCSDGSSRTGTYCLLDIVLNRLNKGVKEIDIAATLEHLRDQRMKFVRNVDQFEFVLTCVAEEVQAILKALPQ